MKVYVVSAEYLNQSTGNYTLKKIFSSRKKADQYIYGYSKTKSYVEILFIEEFDVE